jgi:hypothetical protein
MARVSYSVDTSALLDLWHRCYPPDVFGALWERLDSLASRGGLLAIDEVKRELEKKDDGLHKWIVARSSMIVTLDRSIQERAASIINRFPSLTNTKSVMRGSADPFVIALAQERNLTVVTAEKSKPTKPRIPDVCGVLRVPCVELVEMFRKEGWKV